MRFTSSRAWRAPLLLGAAGLVTGPITACSSDWDLLDPRLGTSSNRGGSAAGGAGAAGGAVGANGGTSSGGSGSGGSGSGASGAGGAGGAGALGNGGMGGVPQPGTLTLVASVADCVYEVDPDPDVCEAAAGVGNMTVDTDVDGLGTTTAHSFVRFDLDGTIAGQTVTSVLLRLTVSGDASADSVQSGDVWEVETFNRGGLFNVLPAQLGTAPLAVGVGAVLQNELVEFILPVDSVTADAPTTLGIYATSANGVDYQNLNGAVPPELLIEYQ